MVQSRTILAALTIALLGLPAAATAQGSGEQQLAVIPLQNLAELDASEADYLSDVIRGAATHARSGKLSLVPQAKVVKAAGRKIDACGEPCATKVARKTGAELVLLSELRKIGDELRATVKLLSEDGELLGMQRAIGDDSAALEGGLEQAVLELLGEEAEGAPAVTPVPAPPPAAQPAMPVDGSYYADVRVTAMGTKEGDPGSEPRSVAADVFINDRLVGTTPYEDGLPTGSYKIEVKSKGRLLQSRTIDVTAGGSYVVEAAAIIPLTAEERAAIEQERREEREAREELLRQEWEETRTHYEAEAERIGEERRPFLISGTVLLIGGIGLVISGSVLESMAVKEDDRLERLTDDFEITIDPDEIKRLDNEIDEAKHARDVNNALGITFLVVGSASVVTSIVLFAVMPSKPEEPTPPPGLTFAGLELQPLVAPDFAGLSLSAEF